MTDANYLPARVRSNFRIDVFSAVGAGVFVSVLVTFMPVVVRRMGGSATDVAIVICAPFIGHLLSPFFTYLLAHLAPVKVVAGTSTLARSMFLVGMLVATTPLMLALTTVTFWIITISNVAAYTALMRGIYPTSERAHVMGKVHVGASLAGIVAAALAGLYIDLVPARWVFAAAALISLPGSIAFFKIDHSSVGGVRDAPARGPDRARRVGGPALPAADVVVPGIRLGQPDELRGVPDHARRPFRRAEHVRRHPLRGAVGDHDRRLRHRRPAHRPRLGVAPDVHRHAARSSRADRLPRPAPSYWFLLPVAVVAGIAQASGELTYHTNVVHMAPPDRLTMTKQHSPFSSASAAPSRRSRRRRSSARSRRRSCCWPGSRSWRRAR